MNRLLVEVSHRPIPLPQGPWIMKQTWHDLLFMHWPVAPELLRSLVPPELDLDLYAGQAYVAVAPFWMSGIRARFLPPMPGLNRFPELNVRTYVRYKGELPGVYFFSLDAASRPAVWSARAAYGLPYFYAQMSVTPAGENYEYASRRLQERNTAEFRGRYRPIAPPRRRSQGSLEYFLTERYCLYTTYRRRLVRAYIHHLPWRLQDAEAEVELNTMTQAAGIPLPPAKPLLHYSRKLDVLVWWPERV
jgi:uncharacterized protein YqjF (DUF2071 family)